MHFCKQTGLRVGGGVLMLVMLLFVSNPLYAQNATGELAVQGAFDVQKTDTIREVVVTANRQRFLVSSPMPAQILTKQELEKVNTLSVADAIRYFSGVQLKDYGGVGGIKTINVRSLGSAHTAVFYDGMSIGNAQNGQVDLGKYSLDNIEAIELYNGQKSAILQPARGLFSSNTLFLQSKTPHFGEGERTRVGGACRVGSFGLVNPSILYQQKVSSAMALVLSGEWTKAHGRYKYRYKKDGGYDTTAVRQNGDVQALRLESCLFLNLPTNGQARLRCYFYDSERGLPGAIVANRFNHVQRQWDRNFFVHGSLQRSFFKNHELLGNAKFSRDYIRYVDPDFKTLDGALDNRYYQNEVYLSLANQAAVFSWFDVALATDFSLNTLHANLDFFPYPTRYSYLATLSGHVKWQRVDAQLNMLAGYVDEKVKRYQKGDSRRVFCPVVSVSVQPFSTESFRLRGFYKESFRMPTFNDLYYTFVGNSSLRPEYTTQYNVGATWLYNCSKGGGFRSLSIQADGYYNRVKDKIVAMPSSNLFRWTMMNLGEVEIKGLEGGANLGFSLPFKIQLDVGLNYTYQKAIDITSGGTTYGHQIPYTPVHSGTLTTSIQWRSLQLNYSFIYTGERYSQKENILRNYVQPWYTHDMAVVWRGKVFQQPIKLGFEVNNLLNQYYDVVLNFPMPGRNYRFNLSINI